MKSKILSATTVLAALVCLATFAGYLGSFYWIFDLFAHFRLQYAALLFLTMLAFWRYRKMYWLTLVVVFLAANMYEVGAVFFGGNKKEDLQQYLKISSINLLSTNGHEQAVLRFIRSTDPDVLVLLEFTERWETTLSRILKKYPYQKIVNRTDNFGIAILSKVEVQNTTELNLSPAGVPSLLATLLFDGQRLQILATHPPPPIGQQRFAYRNAQFSSMVDMKNALHDKLVIIGDLNTTSYSIHFKKLVDGLQLVDSRKGFGILPTWPAWFYPLRITIDHCLVSPDIFVRNRSVGEPLGSDHLPIYLEIGFQ